MAESRDNREYLSDDYETDGFADRSISRTVVSHSASIRDINRRLSENVDRLTESERIARTNADRVTTIETESRDWRRRIDSLEANLHILVMASLPLQVEGLDRRFTDLEKTVRDGFTSVDKRFDEQTRRSEVKTDWTFQAIAATVGIITLFLLFLGLLVQVVRSGIHP